jgi:hypothetical protein
MARREVRLSRAAELGTPSDVLLQQLDDAVEQIIRAVTELEDPELVRVDEWSAKDTLGHIAFWHESFARNVSALASGRQPDVLAGTYPDLNRRGVEESRASSAAQIAERITRAQTVIRECILELPGDTRIPYRKGSRDYSPAEHLIIVRDHIHAHRHRIEQARRRRR